MRRTEALVQTSLSSGSLIWSTVVVLASGMVDVMATSTSLIHRKSASLPVLNLKEWVR